MLSAGVNYVRIHDKYGVQYMIKQKWKIRKNGILVEKSESSLALFCFPVANLLNMRSAVKILI